MCGKEIDIELAKDLKLCSKCVQLVHAVYSKFTSVLEEEILEKYNVFMPQGFNIPVIECNCNYSSVLVFDYYTKKISKNMYCLVLCGMCRKCNGYKKIVLEDVVFPYHIRDAPKHIGLSVIELQQEEVNYIG